MQKAVSHQAFLSKTSGLLSNRLADSIYNAVTAPTAGSHLGEATFLATIAVAIGYYQGGFRSFEQGFLMPLSAHDIRLDKQKVPVARYETDEMKSLLESFRRVWMSDTVRTSLVDTLSEYGLAIPTFACSGVAVVPSAAYNTTLQWYRESGWQMQRALVDQGDCTFGPEHGYCSLEDLPTTIDLSETQLSAIEHAYKLAAEMSGTQLRLVA